MKVLPKNSLAVKHKRFLQKLFRSAKNPRQLSTVLRRAKPQEIRSLGEIAYNLLHRSLPNTSRKLVTTLKPYRSIFRKLGNTKASVPQKRQLLLRQAHQSGGLPFLIPFLAPILGTLVAAGIDQVI